MTPVTYRHWFTVVSALPICAAACLLAGVLYSIHTTREHGYPENSSDAFLLLMDNAFQSHKTSCDVLIYGDSTALVGLDPRVITGRTGLSACNIASSRPVVDDLGTIPVDAFLDRNPKPKLLVLQFGPETFYRASKPWEHGAQFETMVTLTRELPLGFALWKLMEHPAETSQFVAFMLKARFHLIPVGKVSDTDFAKMLRHAEQSNGQLDLNMPPREHCESYKSDLYGSMDAAWVKLLRQRYESQGIPVVLRVSPIPSCDLQLARFQQDLTPVVDGGITLLPIAAFSRGDRHTTQDGSQLATLGLAQAIQTRLPLRARQGEAQ